MGRESVGLALMKTSASQVYSAEHLRLCFFLFEIGGGLTARA
jgi:hypothetical protein